MSQRHDAARDRAEIVFTIYHTMGEGGGKRSLRRLKQQLDEAGLEISLATLERYSVDYGWQSRIAKLDAENAKLRADPVINAVSEMYDRHAQRGRTLFSVAGLALRKLLEDPERLGTMAPAEISRMTDLAARMEREATGETATRDEFVVRVCNALTSRIVPRFLEVNELPDPKERAREFVEAFDRIIGEQLAYGAEGDASA